MILNSFSHYKTTKHQDKKQEWVPHGFQVGVIGISHVSIRCVEKHNHRRKTKPQIQEIELQIYLLDSVANTVMAAYIDQGKRGVVFKTINKTKTKTKTKKKQKTKIFYV